MGSSLTSKSKIRITVAVTCGLAVLAFVALLVAQREAISNRSLIAAFVLAVACIAATNIEVATRASVRTSGLPMVLVATLVVFRAYEFLPGAVVVAACACIDIQLIRAKSWQKIAFNASSESLSVLCGASVLWIANPAELSLRPILLLLVTGSALIYLITNAVLVSVPVSLSCEEPYRQVLRELVVLDIGAFPFALLGVGVGAVYLEFGPVVLPLIIVPLLIARHAFAVYLELKHAQEKTIETLICALEAKDRYTAGHAQRVATFASYMAEEFNFGPRRCERLRYAALMHDIGKLVVPNQLLNKPGRLTEAEFDRVRKHELVSVELLGRIDFLAPVARDTTTEAATAAVDSDRLVEAAIIHVADAFDAMTSTRSYRRALTQETAFAELRNGRGSQFNPECVEALIAAVERRSETYGYGHETDSHNWEVAPPVTGAGSAGLGDLVSEEAEAGSRQP
jgi:HD superfamily phosphodiesterase